MEKNSFYEVKKTSREISLEKEMHKFLGGNLEQLLTSDKVVIHSQQFKK